jgi:hypothetical protein
MLTATTATTRETLPIFDLPVRSVLNVGVDTRPHDKWLFEGETSQLLLTGDCTQNHSVMSVIGMLRQLRSFLPTERPENTISECRQYHEKAQ